MAGSVNKVILVGNLGADPEVRTFPSGDKYCRFSVATSERWRDRESGEQRERTEWHNVTVYSAGLVRVAEQYLRKGHKVYIEGQLETRKWKDQNDQDRYTTSIALRGFRGSMTMLERRSDGDSWSGGDGDYSRDGGGDYSRSSSQSQDGSSGGPPPDMQDDLDDNIPF